MSTDVDVSCNISSVTCSYKESSYWLTDAYRAAQLHGFGPVSMLCGTHLGVCWSSKHKAGQQH